MDSYTDNLRKIKSLSIVTSLQKRSDVKAHQLIESFDQPLTWTPLTNLMIDQETWEYITTQRNYDPKFVFCHPEILLKSSMTSLYYRGLTGLSVKAARDYLGSIENLEKGNLRSRLSDEKALKMSRVYNTFICSIIKGSTDWTLENGKRTIIATMGITLDGSMRNKVGEIAEERVRSLIFEWITDKGLLISPTQAEAVLLTEPPVESTIKGNITMKFSSEPDISFYKKTDTFEELLAVIEIKGGIDPAGALERYGAATKSFQHALSISSNCKNFFLSAVFTPELERRIQKDRLIEKYFDIIKILEDSALRDRFFEEVFHYTLRVS